MAAKLLLLLLVFAYGCCTPATVGKTTTVTKEIESVTQDTLNVTLSAYLSYKQDTVIVNDTVKLTNYVTAYKDTVITVYRNKKLYKDTISIRFNEKTREFGLVYKPPVDTTYKTIVTTENVIEARIPWYEKPFFILLIIAAIIGGTAYFIMKARK